MVFSNSKKIVLFRCDAGARYGLGHLSRCKVISKALTDIKINTIFAISAPRSIIENLRSEGAVVVEVNSHVDDSEDINLWIDLLPNLVIVDSPNITDKYLHEISNYSKVCYIDDDIQRNFSSDLVINNHPWASKELYTNQANLLIGPYFNTVNENFFFNLKERDGLLITMGGEDPNNVTGWILDCLKDYKFEFPVYVIVGPAHPDLEGIKKICCKFFPAAIVVFAPSSLLPYYRRCSIALTAAGTTAYELIASNIRFGVFSLESSQNVLEKYMIENSYALSIGSYENFSKKILIAGFKKLTSGNIDGNNKKSKSTLFETPGAKNIAKTISTLI